MKTDPNESALDAVSEIPVHSTQHSVHQMVWRNIKLNEVHDVNLRAHAHKNILLKKERL